MILKPVRHSLTFFVVTRGQLTKRLVQ